MSDTGWTVTKTETAASGSVRTYVTTDDGRHLVVTTARRDSTGPKIAQAIAAAIATRPTGENLP